MPVYEHGKLVWFQARAVLYGQQPKYLNPTGDRKELVFWSKQDSHAAVCGSVPGGGGAAGSCITVVEDILSAVRTGAVTPACSLLGTKITVQQANKLGAYDLVRTWLDPDAAGISGAYNIGKLLGMVTEVQNIVTDSDPKCYCNAEIARILSTQGEGT
jgi:hypothetical protein